MQRLLVAITYHSQKRSTVHKTWQSAISEPWPDGWQVDTRAFCFDRPMPHKFAENSIITGEETLGGKRNFAINYSRANNYQLISFLDDDDLFGSSWISGLCAAYDGSSRIFHPQWNVLFGPDWFKLHEHIAENDPRFDSRDGLLNNPWSALCAFDPMHMTMRYRAHRASDPRESFEDWSFNLDTYTAGIEHVVVPNTFHFLRIRKNSLGKSTDRCATQHTEFFLDSELRNKKHATEEYQQDKYKIDEELLKKEVADIHEIEPQIYYYDQAAKGIEQEHYGRCKDVSSAIDSLGDLRRVRDVFWTVDHLRAGGAEKAIGFAARFLARFPLGENVGQAWIDDIVPAKNGNITVTEWPSALRNVLKAWQDHPGSSARSIHICNSFMGWQAMTYNPALFDKVQVYFYVFNDDLRFADESFDPETRGYHSPLYRFADQIDRPNFHIVTDSAHFAQRIHRKTGLGDKVRIIDIPVIPQGRKRKKQPDGKIDILWAGRLDHWKGIELLCNTAELLDPKKYMIHVFGDGEQKWKDMLANPKCITYWGPYKSFEYITGEYDYFLFTSEREGMPNTAKEALSSGLRVLARRAEWAIDDPTMEENVYGDLAKAYDWKYEIRSCVFSSAEECVSQIKDFSDALMKEPMAVNFSFESAIPRAMNAYKECLTWLR